jgi:hypothetical protein
MSRFEVRSNGWDKMPIRARCYIWDTRDQRRVDTFSTGARAQAICDELNHALACTCCADAANWPL